MSGKMSDSNPSRRRTDKKVSAEEESTEAFMREIDELYSKMKKGSDKTKEDSNSDEESNISNYEY